MALCGSWARGDTHQGSDIDLLLLSDRAAEHRLHQEWLAEISFEGAGYRILWSEDASHGVVWSRHITLMLAAKVELTLRNVRGLERIRSTLGREESRLRNYPRQGCNVSEARKRRDVRLGSREAIRRQQITSALPPKGGPQQAVLTGSQRASSRNHWRLQRRVYLCSFQESREAKAFAVFRQVLGSTQGK
jgi:predicted nucleotidyltransferase